ncbi:MAG: RloB family protein [Armatimonadota bacterium]|nr:RloB family protein [Armatimonadota bacterium]
MERKQRKRDARPVVLIACEGTETEPIYFRAIFSELKLLRERLIFAPHQGPHPRSVVKAAVQARGILRAAKEWNDQIDHAWAVIDCDEHRQQSRKRWNDAVETARQQNIFLAVSNPSFELWYLLHYQDQSANLEREEARRLLKKYLPDYDKPDRLYPTPLKELTEAAIQRAKVLEDHAREQALGEYTNPSTGVWKLVLNLRAL